MPRLFIFLIRHAAFGFAIAVVTLMMITDFAKLRTLIIGSDGAILPLFLLTFFLGPTLASVQIRIAVILLRDDRSGRDIEQGSRPRAPCKAVVSFLSSSHCSQA